MNVKIRPLSNSDLRVDYENLEMSHFRRSLLMYAITMRTTKDLASFRGLCAVITALAVVAIRAGVPPNVLAAPLPELEHDSFDRSGVLIAENTTSVHKSPDEANAIGSQLIKSTMPENRQRPSVLGRVKVDGPIPVVPPLELKLGLILRNPRNAEEIRENEQKIKDAPVTEIPDDSLIVSRDGGIANVVIYLKKPPKDWKPTVPSEEPVELRSEVRRFEPRVAIVRTGQTLRLLAPRTEVENFTILPLRSQGIDVLVTHDSTRDLASFFAHAEKHPTPVSSKLHPWQKAWLFALDHPFAAITDASGRFEIGELPVGEHHFTVWHERRGYLNKDLVVRVEKDKTTEINLSFPAEILKSK